MESTVINDFFLTALLANQSAAISDYSHRSHLQFPVIELRGEKRRSGRMTGGTGLFWDFKANFYDCSERID